jgi:hypothetical protein
MSPTSIARAVAAAGLFLSAGLAAAESPLELVRASFFGTAGNDDIQGGCAGPDGSIYLAGNTGAPMESLPGGAAPARLGRDAEKPRCGHGFVARLTADGSKVAAYAEFAKGILSITSVQVNAQGVYVAGYATDALEPLLKEIPGVLRDYPLRKEVKLLEEGKWVEAVGEDTSKPDPIPESKNGQLGRYGAPCVLRLSADMSKIECGAYLEGWQQVWFKHRQIGRSDKKQAIMVPPEYSWQPTHVAALRSGEILVCHDGGYFRLLTPEDRALVEKLGVPRNAHRLGFYDVCDHLSKLSPDLAKRTYRKPIYTPATDVETAKRLKDGWPLPHFSNPRTHRMRLDAEENVYLCGWSASATSRESWWSPYVWKMSASDGSLIQKVEEKDPMSGGDNRMGGAVADRGIGAIAIDGNDVISSSYSDGGWSGVIHFSGSIWRTDLKTKETVRIARTGPCFWTVDMAVLPQRRLLAVGRFNGKVQWTGDAWQKGEPDENPGAWVQVYGPKPDNMLYSAAIRGIVPYALVPLSATRFLLVGVSRGTLNKAKQLEDKSLQTTEEPNPGVAVVKGALFDKQQGKDDGYFLIVEYRATE